MEDDMQIGFAGHWCPNGLVDFHAQERRLQQRLDKPGVLRRIFEAIFECRQKQADRDIARLLARSGGRFTDEVEREITQRLLMGNRNGRW
jgi:hypothetical protein